jgi:hypothetical protein
MVGRIVKRAAFGFLLGMVIGVLIVVAMGFANGGVLILPKPLLAATGSEAGALLAQMLLSGAFGAVPMAGVTFYELDSWGMLKQAVVHYATYMPTFMLVGVCAGWLDPTLADIGLMAGLFAVGHTIIWLIMYARYKAEVAQLNELLRKSKQAEPV